MMRLLVGLLLVGNLLLFLYGYLELENKSQQPPRQQYLPDVGSIRLLAARVVAVGEKSPLLAAPGERGSALGAPAAAPEAGTPGEKKSGTPAVVEAAAKEKPAVTPGGREETAAVVPEQQETPAKRVPSPAAAPPEAPLVYCGTLGPFRSRIQAKRILRKLGALPEIRMERRPTLVDKSYWVLIPPLADRAEARAVVERLKATGFQDLWLVPRGEMRNAISLGLYSRRDAAYSHAENLRAKGFEVEVRPKQEELLRYWLDFSGLGEAVLAKLDPATLPEGVKLRKTVCEPAALYNPGRKPRDGGN